MYHTITLGTSSSTTGWITGSASSLFFTASSATTISGSGLTLQASGVSGYSYWGSTTTPTKYSMEILGEYIDFVANPTNELILFLTNINTLGYKFWDNYKKLKMPYSELSDDLVKHIDKRCKILKRESKIKDITDDK